MTKLQTVPSKPHLDRGETVLDRAVRAHLDRLFQGRSLSRDAKRITGDRSEGARPK